MMKFHTRGSGFSPASSLNSGQIDNQKTVPFWCGFIRSPPLAKKNGQSDREINFVGCDNHEITRNQKCGAERHHYSMFSVDMAAKRHKKNKNKISDSVISMGYNEIKSKF